MAKWRRTVVLGLGNPLLGDDAVGLEAAARLEELLKQKPLPLVEVRTSQRAGFDLLELLSGFERAILIDALLVPEPKPGRIRRLSLQDVKGSARLVSMHDIHCGTAFALAESLGVPMPSEVEIYGIEVAATGVFSETLSPEAARAAGLVARKIHSQLESAARLTCP